MRYGGGLPHRQFDPDQNLCRSAEEALALRKLG